MDDRVTQLIGEAPAWLSALEKASQLAVLDRPVLVIGERGTGKELIGERLHFLSRRWQGPFIKVNCAALSETLLDSELFGHERGAFTGATELRRGRFETAEGGTIFLDEIATASAQVQEKLLRIVEYGEFQRVGGARVLTANVRIIAAANADLPGLAARGRFRWDLLDRLAFDVITLPPLRARAGDKALLAKFFARRMAIEMKQDFPGFTPSALQMIEAGQWPGNVRQLRNFAERIVYRALLSSPGLPVGVEAGDLDPFESPWRPGLPELADPDRESGQGPARSRAIPDGASFEEAVRRYEKSLIDEALASASGHQGRAAARLGVSYHQFRGLLRKHGYPARRTRKGGAEEDDGA